MKIRYDPIISIKEILCCPKSSKKEKKEEGNKERKVISSILLNYQYSININITPR